MVKGGPGLTAPVQLPPGHEAPCRPLSVPSSLRRLFLPNGGLAFGAWKYHRIPAGSAYPPVPSRQILHDIVHAQVDFSSAGRPAACGLMSRWSKPSLRPSLVILSILSVRMGPPWPAVYQRRRVPTAPAPASRWCSVGWATLVVELHLRDRKVQLVGGLDVRRLLEQVHQLRQVKETGQNGSAPGSWFPSGASSNGRAPSLRTVEAQLVKMGQAQLLQTESC